MDKAIGGYFELELNEGFELHGDAIKLNSGQYALEYILKARKYRKVYLPYYICDSVLHPFKRQGVAYEFYHINELLEPAVELQPKDDEAVLYVNYFGLKNRKTDTFCYSYRNTILDNTQAFYSEPGNKAAIEREQSKARFGSVECEQARPKVKYDDRSIQCDTLYSCRKYFGVPDGAYLYTDCILDEEIPQDESFDRLTFLTKRIDRSAQEAYADFHANDEALANVGMRRMSRLTEKMMRSIDYSAKANKRIHNFHVLDDALRETNRFKWDMDYGTVPMVYPYYVENGAKLRQHLIDNQVFCARYWPNVLEWCKPSEWEYQLSENLVCIPIDQRYDEEDMKGIISTIKQ